MDRDRDWDVVVFGATGFTGRLTAEYLARSAPPEVRWAIAGRSGAKLAELKRALVAIDPKCEHVGVLEASIDDAASLERMARTTRVVATTVGPFARYGEPVVRACVDGGAHYADITGEPEFVDMVLERYDGRARAAGLRIVNTCGFDSIPHDLGALYTVRQLPQPIVAPVTVEGFVRSRGAFSGGTWQSAIEAMGQFRQYRARRRAALSARRGERSARSARKLPPRFAYNRRLKAWVCPLPTIDADVVVRSARMMEEYGPAFRYGHYVRVKRLPTLVAGAVAIGGIVALAQLKPTRQWLSRRKLPGEGPTERERARNWFSVVFHGKSGKARVTTEVRGGDPGYGETAKMLAESALCLALDGARLPARAGVLTPAAAMGDVLIERLERAGITFSTLTAR